MMTHKSKKFCIHCPGKDCHYMSCTPYKGGKVKINEPYYGDEFLKIKNFNHEEIVSKLLSSSSREEGNAILKGLYKMSLMQISILIDIPYHNKNYNQLTNDIIEHTIGSRLISQAIRGNQ